MSENNNNEIPEGGNNLERVKPVSGLYKTWFLEYASYVILDRAVPYINDGLKPVQRRILHALKEMDDGRFNKVANVIGNTMQYHPHGDAAIGDAMVKLGQKELLLDTQGNWGNILTGDSAAAARYIETRLSKFALEVVFNPKTTNWQMSYDGRKREPVTLPVKFPLVLATGVEGIAVGLSTKVLPHNFQELIKASIACLKGQSFTLYPDFPTGGSVDVANYKHGERGGKIRVRAHIEIVDKNHLRITQVPYGTTTTSLIESIVKASEKSKIKIKKIEDNTAKNVDINIYLHSNVSPDLTIDGLYAFTSCESSISPNCCIIIDDMPVFTNVRDVLKISTEKTLALLKRELEIKLGELEDKWHFSSLEKIFIENRIYRDIEESETWEAVIQAIDDGLTPFKPLLKREVTEEDIVRLTEIKIKRISKFDSFKADELVKSLEAEMEKIKHHLGNLIEFAIDYFKSLLEKYGKGKERKTEIKSFDTIKRAHVAIANQKLYMNAKDGFIGSGLKKEEFIQECSDIDDIIIFRKDGAMIVTKVATKTFVGKNIIHAQVFNKGDERLVFHMVYTDKKDKRTYVKRFSILGVTRDKEYFLTKSKEAGNVLYFTANPNGESEVITVNLKGGSKLRKTVFDYDFKDLGVKGRMVAGNLLTKFEVKKIEQKSAGVSTLGGREIWYDEILGRLNAEGNGEFLGKFEPEDKILVIYSTGEYELTGYDLSNRYDNRGKILQLERLTPELSVACIHFVAKNQSYYVKRFQIETTKNDVRNLFLHDSEGSKMKFVTTKPNPTILITFSSTKTPPKEINLQEFIDIKGWKSTGNKLSEDKIRKIELVKFDEIKEPEPEEKEEPETPEVTFEVEDKRTKLPPRNPTLFD